MGIEDANNVLTELRYKDPAGKGLEMGWSRTCSTRNDGRADRAIAGAKKAFGATRQGKAYVAEGDKYSEAKDYVKAIEAYKAVISPSRDAYNGLGLSTLPSNNIRTHCQRFRKLYACSRAIAELSNLAFVHLEMKALM